MSSLEENKPFVKEMAELDDLKKLLDELPYERYCQFVKSSNKGENCVYARKAVEYYKRLMRASVRAKLKAVLELIGE